MEFKGVPIYNLHRARKLKSGGMIYPKSNMTQKQLRHDSVLGILRPGEIVIPIKYKNKPVAKLAKNWLLKNKIYLPHLK